MSEIECVKEREREREREKERVSERESKRNIFKFKLTEKSQNSSNFLHP
jgi:hypothetical protein